MDEAAPRTRRTGLIAALLAAAAAAVLVARGGCVEPAPPIDAIAAQGPIAALWIDGARVSPPLSAAALTAGRPAVPWRAEGATSLGSGERQLSLCPTGTEADGTVRLVLRRGEGPAVALAVRATDASGQALRLAGIGARGVGQPRVTALERVQLWLGWNAPPAPAPAGPAVPTDPGPELVLLFSRD